jgi:multidrug efflux pump subunit AcrA (membrane-fusion protein)
MTGEPIPTESAPAGTTWQNLDDLVDEIASLVHSNLGPREFRRRLLDRTVRALAAVGGTIWARGADGQFSLVCQIQTDREAWDRGSDDERRHARLLAHVADTRLALSLPPRSGSPGDAATDNPSSLLLLVSPVVSDDITRAVVEIYQRPSELPTAPEGYLRFLAAVCELAADYDRQRQFEDLRERANAGSQFERFSHAVHGSLDVRRVTYTIANDGRALVGCDRASVAVVRGRRCRLASVSGVDTLNSRAASVRRLEQLIAAVVAIDEPLAYPEDVGRLPPQIEQALQAHIDESHACQLVVVPLHAPDDGTADDTEPVVIGALVCEYFTPPATSAGVRQKTVVVATQAAIALANALEYESLPAARLWRGLRGTRLLVGRRQLPKTLLAAAALAAVLAALVLVPVELTVEGRGELVPERRRDVFASVDGIVADIRVAHGDTVAKGQTLVVLRRPQLEFERTRVMGELQTARKRLAALAASRFGGAAASAEARDQYHQRSADEEEVKELLKSLGEQMEVLDRQEAELSIVSPIAGQVLTWDVAQSLESRPVQRGQLLLSVGDADGPWELEMRVDDDRIGHVLDARQAPADELDVSFLLAMTPDQTYQARVRDVAMTTDVLNNAGPQVLVTATVDRDTLPRLRPGASVVARIHCGRRSLGYVWLHDLWDAVRTRVFF